MVFVFFGPSFWLLLVILSPVTGSSLHAVPDNLQIDSSCKESWQLFPSDEEGQALFEQLFPIDEEDRALLELKKASPTESWQLFPSDEEGQALLWLTDTFSTDSWDEDIQNVVSLNQGGIPSVNSLSSFDELETVQGTDSASTMESSQNGDYDNANAKRRKVGSTDDDAYTVCYDLNESEDDTIEDNNSRTDFEQDKTNSIISQKGFHGKDFFQWRRHVQSLLLKRLELLTGTMESDIDWQRFEVIGWPKKVVFYDFMSWLETDLSFIQDAIDGISFRYVENPQPLPTMQEKEAAFQDLLAHCKKRSKKSSSIPWQTMIRVIVPDLHLTAINFPKWTHSDLAKVRQLIVKICEMPPETTEDLRKFIHDRLLDVANKSLVWDSKDIPWAQVEVINWPASVLFYWRNHWTKPEMMALSKEMKNIHFIRTEMNPINKFTADERKQLIERITSIAKCLGCYTENIQWKRLRKKFPEIPKCHLTTSTSKYWCNADFLMINTIINVYETRSTGKKRYRNTM